MNQLDTFISPLVKEQFPDFYNEEGPLFVLFAEEYFKWMESYSEVVDGVDVAGKTLSYSRKLLEYGDIDQTVDEFIVYFKEKYLKGVDFDVLSNKKLLIKSALDLFRSKGTERSFDLLFKLVYGTKIEIFTPGDHILKLSDGKWVVPKYLELTRSSKTKDFVGKQITGSQSGATAVIEYLITRNIKGNLIDIVYISSLEGDFLKDDIINTTGSNEGCPKVIGSLTTINLTTQGRGFIVGEEVNLVSARGVEGKARVAGIEQQTGLVQFELIDGGWGFSLDANTIVSTKTLTFTEDLLYVANNTYEYTANSFTYNFDRFATKTYIELLKQYLGKPATDATLKSFLNTTPANTSYKVYDTDNNGSLELTDVLNYLKFALRKPITTTFLNWMQDEVMPLAVSNTYIRNNYIDVYLSDIPKFTNVTQPLVNITMNNIIGEVSNGDILVTDGGNTSVVTASNKSVYTNTALLIVAPSSGNVVSATSLSVPDKAVIVANDSIEFNLGDEIIQTDGISNTATGVVSLIRPVTIVTIDSATSTNNGLTVGNYIYQADSGAYGYISATPLESNYGATNVAVIAVSNTVGTFNNSSAMAVYVDNSNTTVIATATSSGAETGYLYYLTSVAGEWNTGNTISTPTSANATIKIASLVGGTFSTFTDISATGNVMGSNTSSIGVVDIQNAFYGTGVSKLSLVINGNTYVTPNIASVSTGQGADFSVGVINDAETVLLSPDKMSSNNDGPGSNSVVFADMYISGANSTYGYMSDLYIVVGGSGYDNTDVITFSGGTSGTDAGNGAIVTDANGTITGTALSANVGSGYYETPTVTILTSGGSPSSGSGADIVPLFPLGFPKLPEGDLSYLLLDLLRFESKTIGTIGTLTGINPGENYNADPFALAHEPAVASYGKKDYILKLANTSGSFISNELIYQYNEISTITITGNNYSGNTTTFDLSEYVYVTDGSNITAEGTVRAASQGATSHIIVLENTSGTFNVSDVLIGLTSNSHLTITDVNDTTSDTITAKGRVAEYNANTNTIYAKRISLFSDYQANSTNYLIGLTSGANAEITEVAANNANPVIGINSVIEANVITANGSISGLTLISSGFGYVQDEGIDITSLDGERIATGKAVITNQGTAEGRYTSYDGFTDNYRYIHDGDYYQEYSYEVQSSIPFDKYRDLLKQVLHVAGTKMFGRYTGSSFSNTTITVANSSITLS